MLACEPLVATRIVATPSALDGATWPPGTVLRVADDEVVFVGDDQCEVALADEHAIIESDHGWAGVELDADALADLIRHHIEWPLPDRPALAQGQIAGVPAKLHLPADSGGALLICLTALAHELEERVG